MAHTHSRADPKTIHEAAGHKCGLATVDATPPKKNASSFGERSQTVFLSDAEAGSEGNGNEQDEATDGLRWRGRERG